MRLWHKDLISVLPKQQLLGQWHEVCCIARNISVNNTPNHILVNKIMNYPCSHFNTYAIAIYKEMIKRGYKCDWNKYEKWCINTAIVELNNIFPNWHDDRYLLQCYYNLQEKYDCSGITDYEWQFVHNATTRILNSHRYERC